MKHIKSAVIIIAIYLIATYIQESLNLPIPSSVLGMCILLILLITKIVKLHQIEELVDFLLKHLSLLFIPGGVALLTVYNIISKDIVVIVIVTVLTTIITLVVSGKVIDIYMRRKSHE